MNYIERKKVAAYTLGCKVNMYDTEAMLELFKKEGYEVTDFDKYADVYIINTCTVTNLGDKKSRQMIRRAKRLNENSVVAAVGCYAQVAPEEVGKIEGVNLVLGTKERNKIVELVERENAEKETFNNVTNIMDEHEFEEMTIEDSGGRCRAYIKIEEGCDRYCSYCIIPYARGTVRSRHSDDVLRETEKLADNGYKEIVLAGIHVASYGKDLDDMTLIEIIENIHKIDMIERIRMSSIEPKIIDDDFIQRIKRLPKVCDHFHLSLQSGCDKTLKKMNRKYTSEEYKIAVEKLRRAYPDIALTTDVIVGFPGETDEDFEKSYNFVKDIQLSQIHVFPYSPKKGTPAAKFENQVSQEIKNKRSNKMIELSHQLNENFIKQFVNKEKNVLFERLTDEGFYEGHTTNYIPVRIKCNSNLINKVCKVKINDVKNGYAYGNLKQL